MLWIAITLNFILTLIFAFIYAGIPTGDQSKLDVGTQRFCSFIGTLSTVAMLLTLLVATGYGIF